MIEVALQKTVFPNDERLESYWELFYRGPRCAQIDEGLRIAEGICVDFFTYINGFPLKKWNQYTGVCSNNVALKITGKGRFRIRLTGYSLSPSQPLRHEYAAAECDFREKKCITLSYPEADEAFLAYEIEALEGTCTLTDAEYTIQCDEKTLRNIDLCIVTTTCFKENDIRRNVARIRAELLEGGQNRRKDSVSDHLYVNVIDNGRSLLPEEIEGPHIRLVPNNNAGGSGGYARGIMEAMHQIPKMTHVLLMDDDVLVLPESIRRTYTLLRLAKEEYADAFVSGAMLEMDEMDKMHEDIGMVFRDGALKTTKPHFKLTIPSEIIKSNLEPPREDGAFWSCAWWYCCIPRSQIEKNGLPLPLFLGIDDVDYSLRCNPSFMSMSGICIWHVGFEEKFNFARDYYQMYRNLLIVQAVEGILDAGAIERKWENDIRRTLLTYNYDGCELLLRAMEAFLEGPEALYIDKGYETLRENSKLNEKLIPLNQIHEMPLWLDNQLDTVRPPELELTSPLQKLYYYLTYNGQRYYTSRKTTNVPAIVHFDWGHLPCEVIYHSRILAINKISRTGRIRTMDKERFRELFTRFQNDRKRYQQEHEQLEHSYRSAKTYLTSEEFWKKYLEIQDKNV